MHVYFLLVWRGRRSRHFENINADVELRAVGLCPQTTASWRVHANYRYIFTRKTSQKIAAPFSFVVNACLVFKKFCSTNSDCADVSRNALYVPRPDIRREEQSEYKDGVTTWRPGHA